MDEPSILTPILSTDTKTLYDNYHKESLEGANSVDKRISLEIRIAKEQIASLNDSLRWINNKYQYMDKFP